MEPDTQTQTLDTPRPRPLADYGGEGEVPLGGYTVLLGTYALLVGASFALVRKKLPRRIGLGDLLLLGVAAHQVARTVTKDRVTSPLRAPFVKFEDTAGSGELSESARGRGLQQAIGHLLTCPYCAAPWIAAPLLLAFVAKPRVTRAGAAIFAMATVSDALNYGRAMAKKKT